MDNSTKPPENLQRDLVVLTHRALRALVHPQPSPHFVALHQALPHLFAMMLPSPEDATRAVLERALAHLATRSAEHAALLRARFWERRSIQHLACEQHRSVSSLYARQAEAVCALAQALWEMEQCQAATQQANLARRRRNLPAATWTKLFGVEEPLARAQAWLRDPRGPHLISIEGLGGIGKTSLAHAIVQSLLTMETWNDLAWIAIASHPYPIWTEPATALDAEGVLEQMAWQLGWEEIARLAPPLRRAALQQHLTRAPYLIVIDDVEPSHESERLMQALVPLLQPTRVIVTTRQRWTTLPLGAHLPLRELERAPAYELLCDEMARHHLPAPDEVWLARVYDLVGGNPLALKLVAGQAVSLPLEHIVENLRTARGAPAETLWYSIYQRSWDLLSDAARQTIVALLTFSPRGATYDELGIATALPAAQQEAALQQLIAHSLVFFDGARYTMHRLTHTFLLSMTLGVPQ